MLPAGSGRVASSPPVPVQVVGAGLAGAGEQGVQAADFGDGQWDQAGVFGWVLVGCQWWWGQGGGLVAHGGGGGRADRQGRHGQGEVADDGLVEADLAVVEGELVLADLDGPAHTGDGDQRTQRGRVAYGDVAAEVGLVGGVDQDAADQLAVVGAGAP